MVSFSKIFIAIAIIAQTTDIAVELEKIKVCQESSAIANEQKCQEISHSVEKLVEAGKSLQNIDLSNIDLRGVRLEKADLKNANLDSANIDGANFTGANLEELSFRSYADESFRVTSNVNFHRANLKGADFRRGEFSDTDFSNANLSETKFDGILWSSDFSNANLQQAKIQGQVTSKFTKADLSRADLSDTRIYWSSFEEANLSGAKLNKTQFLTTNLDWANFVDADLSDAQFALNYASDEPGTTLVEANFTNANLQGATFAYYTDLKNTVFQGANLKQAIFIRTKNLTPSQIKSACNWEQAIYNLDPERNTFSPQITEEDRQASQKYIEKLKQDRTSDPPKPMNCDRWK